MTPLSVLVFVAVIAMGVCLAWCLASRAKETDLPSSEMLEAEASRLERYRIMARLFSQEDHDFITESANILGAITAERLHKARRRILRLYLRELRSDFSRFWSLCRLLAPYAPDPNFGAMLVSQLFLFHFTLSLVWLRTFGVSFSLEYAQFSLLVDAVQDLRDAAQSAVEGAEHAALGSSAA